MSSLVLELCKSTVYR